MADLKTTYMGLELDSPIIVSSSRLTMTLDGVKRCEQAGAGAVVLKSIFEEQINADAAKMLEGADHMAHTEAFDLFANRSHDYYIDSYLELVERAKKELSIPVIASVNCISHGTWLDYAHRFEEVGADALEINAYIIPSNPSKSGAEIEREYLELVRSIRSRVSIPLALKMGMQFSGLAHMIKSFDDEKVDACVLFNRFYRTDIDIEKEQLVPGSVISAPEEAALPLQWTALVADQIKGDICANSGIHTPEAAIKQLLAGASAVGICSAIMKGGLQVIEEMNDGISAWMDKKEYRQLSDFTGKLSQQKTTDPSVWERTQYIKAVSGIE
ncbi:MAG: dihydroorotate dehydrogenase-like protein [Spirochaetota bacterium]